MGKKIWKYHDFRWMGTSKYYCSICGQPTRQFVSGRGYDGQLYREVVVCSSCVLSLEGAYRNGGNK